MNKLQMPVTSCGPCLTEAQLKKQIQQEMKDLKTTINFLVKNSGYQNATCQVIGELITRFINLQGPLK